MDTDRNLLFGVLALQADLIDNDHFAEVCSAWASRKETPLADLLVERGWLTAEDRADVEKLLARKLSRHKGDVKASLAEAATDRVRHSLAGLADEGVRESLAGLTTPPAAGHAPVPPRVAAVGCSRGRRRPAAPAPACSSRAGSPSRVPGRSGRQCNSPIEITAADLAAASS
jgi:hypothetical protein